VEMSGTAVPSGATGGFNFAAVEGAPSASQTVATFTDSGGAEAVDFAYSDFSSTAGLQLNGNAAQAGTALRLVPATFGQAGSAFLTTPVNPNATFESQFQFLLHNGSHGERTSRAWNAKEFRQVRCAPPRPFPFDFQRPLVRIAAQQ